MSQSLLLSSPTGSSSGAMNNNTSAPAVVQPPPSPLANINNIINTSDVSGAPNNTTPAVAPLANNNNLINNNNNEVKPNNNNEVKLNSSDIKPNNNVVQPSGGGVGGGQSNVNINPNVTAKQNGVNTAPSPNKIAIPRIKKPTPPALKPAQPSNQTPTNIHPKPILPAPHNPSPVKTGHVPIAAKPSSVTNIKPAVKTSPKLMAAPKSADDQKSAGGGMHSLPSINTLTNGATFNLNQGQFYQFVPMSSHQLAAYQAGANGAHSPLIIATTSMPKSFLAAKNLPAGGESNSSESSSSSSSTTGPVVMKALMPNGMDPLLQQQYLNMLHQQQKQQQQKVDGGVKTASPTNSTAKPTTVLPKPPPPLTSTTPQHTQPVAPVMHNKPNDDYLALQQRLLAEERRNNLLETKLREQEMLQHKQQTHHQNHHHQHIQPSPTSGSNCHTPSAIKPKPIAVKPAPNDSKTIATPENVKKSSDSTISESSDISSAVSKSSSSSASTPTPAVPKPTPPNTSGKKRGRPRLYEVNPQTGKSMKPKQTNSSGGSMAVTIPTPPQLVKMVINPSNNILIMGVNDHTNQSAPQHNTTSSAGMFPSPSTSTTSSDPCENTAPPPSLMKQDTPNEKPPQPQHQRSPNLTASKSDSEKENTIDEQPTGKRGESGSPSKRKKTTPIKVPDSEMTISNKTTTTTPKALHTTPPLVQKPSSTSSGGIPKQITPAELSPSAPLTHYLDGFVVKEAGKPFPLVNESSSKKNSKSESSSFKCEQCGAKVANKKGISGSGDDQQTVLFCSESCVKRYQKKSKHHRSDSTEASKRFKHDQEGEDLLTRTPPRQKLNSSIATDSPSSKRSPHCKHHGSSSKHKHHSSSHKKDRHSTSRHHNHSSQNDDMAMDSSFVHPATASSALASSSQQQALIRTSSPNTSLNETASAYPSGDPTNWSCDQVYQFVHLVTNNEQVARLFKTEEVDGSALSLIRDDHLVQTMQVKLGPALKIMSKFNELKLKYGHH